MHKRAGLIGRAGVAVRLLSTVCFPPKAGVYLSEEAEKCVQLGVSISVWARRHTHTHTHTHTETYSIFTLVSLSGCPTALV